MLANDITGTAPKLATHEGRAKLTKMLMKLLDQWQLTTAEQLKLIGLRETSRNMLINYRNAKNALPYEQDKLDRVGILLTIYRLLHDLFPSNKSLRNAWIKRKNEQLKGKRPIDIMLTGGLFGLAHVMRFLELQMVT